MSDPRETELLAQIEAQAQRIAQQTEEVARLGKEKQLLQERIDVLLRKIYGAKSEKADVHQLQLLLQELHAPGPAVGKGSSPEATEIEPPRRRKISRQRRGARLPEHLPVVEEVIIPEAVQTAPEAWRRMGEEVTERLDFEPARFFKHRIVRPKYVRRQDSDAGPLIAPLPPCILEGSILTAGLLAQILVAKYCDHLPLYRQESIYRSRHGVELSRQSMAQWVGVAADWLTLIYAEMSSGVMNAGYVQIDETPIRYLAPGHGKTKTGYFWTVHQPGGDVIFNWQTSRAAECLEKIIPVNFSGTIQCDAYAAYDAFARQRAEEIALAGCWTHVRRKFADAAPHAPRAVALVLHLLQNLYRLEARLRKTRAGPKLRAIARDLEARPVIRRLRHLLLGWQQKHRFLPQSLIGKAIDHALAQGDSLLLYLDDGRIEIDTNLVENAIRPTAIGKKNWLFIGEANAGDRSAIIYTIIESCRRRGLDPYAYLRDLFTRLPAATNQQIKDLTPEGWAKAQRANLLHRAA
jgi:transposase